MTFAIIPRVPNKTLVPESNPGNLTERKLYACHFSFYGFCVFLVMYFSKSFKTGNEELFLVAFLQENFSIKLRKCETEHW